MKYPWNHNRRFNAASNYLRNHFGSRIQKVTIDAGFTCPNRDGSRSTGGCTFCNNKAFNPSYCTPSKTVTQQINEGIEFHEKRYKKATNYLAYFQAYSNTYGDVEHLKKVYYEALGIKGVTGIIIGTRPDCFNQDIYNLLKEINNKYYLIVEIGIESIYNKTLERINRGHTFEETKDTLYKLYENNIKCGGHLIFGLPEETKKQMLESAEIISHLPLHSLKFHQLQVIKHTAIGNEYESNPNKFQLFSLNEYIDFISNYLQYLNPEIIIERLAGETQPWHNIGEKWNLRYDQVLNLIERYMEEQDMWQGKLFKPNKQNKR